jgi:hypothetical protein
MEPPVPRANPPNQNPIMADLKRQPALHGVTACSAGPQLTGGHCLRRWSKGVGSLGLLTFGAIIGFS